MLSAGGGYEMAVTTHVKTTWKKLRELLPVLTSRHLSYKTLGLVYSSCVQRNDRAMIRRSSELLAKFQLEDLDSFCEREGFAGLGMWSVRVVQSEQHMTYRLKAGEGQGGPIKHGRN